MTPPQPDAAPPREAHVPSAELIDRLNAWWRLGGPAPGSLSLTQRIARPIRRLVARLLRQQEAFNGAVVDYVNTTLRPLERDHAQLRTSVSVLHQAVHALGRDLARRPDARSGEIVRPVDIPQMDALSYRYIGFEDHFRGAPDTIRAAQADYVPLFAGAADVLDIGCGRGEFLSLLAAQGVRARGIDLNDAMVAACHEKGLEATKADALGYLRAQPAASLGGIFAAQVVEHLEPAYLTHLLDAAFDALRPGAPIVLETINPACWAAFFDSYLRDITHVQPLHPDTLRFLLLAAGFQTVEVRFRAPYPDHAKLQPVTGGGDALRGTIETLNANIEKTNRLLFGYQDYAAVGIRP